MNHEEGTTTIKYNGIRPDDPAGRNGLMNPERGWRLETVIAEPTDASAEPSVHGTAWPESPHDTTPPAPAEE